jgi:hypothetical protein
MLREVFHHPGRIQHVYGERASSSRALAKPNQYAYHPDPALVRVMLDDHEYIEQCRRGGHHGQSYRDIPRV